MAVANNRQLIYFADPMCSWCWGFSPVIERIYERYGADLPIRLVMGGLRAGNSKPMDQAMKDEISGHWRHVQKMTGQKFDFSFFERQGVVYDTGPACRALVAARRISGGKERSRELAFLAHLHEAFYLQNVDITSGPELLRLAVEFGFDKDEFATAFAGDECSRDLAGDFASLSSNGIRAFPALLGGSEAENYIALTHGWRSFEELAPAIERLINAKTLSGLMPGVPSAGGCSKDSCS